VLSAPAFVVFMVRKRNGVTMQPLNFGKGRPMSRKAWKRCPITGIPVARLKELPVVFLADDDTFDPWSLEDCDLFDWGGIAAAAGFTNVYDFKRRALAPCSSYFHLHQLKSDEWPDDDKWPLGIATTQHSAEIGGQRYRAAMTARQLAGKRPDVVEPGVRGGRPRRDLVPGSTGLASQPLVETRVVPLDEPQPGVLRVSG
jgi:hypothetical protein